MTNSRVGAIVSFRFIALDRMTTFQKESDGMGARICLNARIQGNSCAHGIRWRQPPILSKGFMMVFVYSEKIGVVLGENRESMFSLVEKRWRHRQTCI